MHAARLPQVPTTGCRRLPLGRFGARADRALCHCLDFDGVAVVEQIGVALQVIEQQALMSYYGGLARYGLRLILGCGERVSTRDGPLRPVAGQCQ